MGRLEEPTSPAAISKAEGRKMSTSCWSYMCHRCSGRMGRRKEQKGKCQCKCHE